MSSGAVKTTQAGPPMADATIDGLMALVDKLCIEVQYGMEMDYPNKDIPIAEEAIRAYATRLAAEAGEVSDAEILALADAESPTMRLRVDDAALVAFARAISKRIQQPSGDGIRFAQQVLKDMHEAQKDGPTAHNYYLSAIAAIDASIAQGVGGGNG